MAFLDDVKRLGKNIAEKGKDVLEITKLNTQIATEKDKIRELYEKIGQEVYSAYANGESSEFVDLCVQIREIENKVKELSDKVLELKNAVKCPNCGAELTKDTIYCPKCGTKVQD